MARPREIDREDLKKKMLEYLDSDGYKTITKFCVEHRFSRRYLYKLFEEDEELRHIGELIALERENALEVGGLSGDLNPSMAKFALNQLGWTDKHENKNENKSTVINIDRKDAEL